MHVVHVYFQSIALEYATTKWPTEGDAISEDLCLNNLFLDPWSDKSGNIV